jgi:hypothetical protein
MTDNCVFCEIVADRAPAEVVAHMGPAIVFRPRRTATTGRGMADQLGPVLHEFTADIIARIQAELDAARPGADHIGWGLRLIFYPELVGWSIDATPEVPAGGLEVLRSHPGL